MNIPEHYTPVCPYIVLPIGAEGFIEFIKDVFAAEEKLLEVRDDGSIMHAEFSLNGGLIMFAHASDKWEPQSCGIFLPLDNVDEMYANGIERGATGNQEPGDYGYGRAAGLIDPWGNQWWLNSPEMPMQ